MNDVNAIPALDERVGKLQSEIETARQGADLTKLPVLLKRLGQVYLEMGDAPAALTEFNEAVRILGPEGDQETQAHLMGLKGLALKQIGNYPLAMQAFLKSNAFAQKIGHAQLTCDSFIQISMLQSEGGKHTEALATLSKAMDLALQHQDLPRKMRVCSLMANNFYTLQAFDKAVDYYVLAYETARDLGNHQAECSFLIRVADIFLLERELVAAIGQYERALKIASAIEDRVAEISILGGLFRAQALSGNERLAVVYGGQAIELAGQINLHEAEITNIKALAVFLLELGQADKAIPYLERGLQLAGEQENLIWQLDLLEKLGLAYHQREEYSQSLRCYQQGLEAAGRLQDEPSEAVLLGRMSAVQADLGNIQESIETAQKALALANEFGDEKLAAEQQVLLAFNFRDSGQKEKSIQYCQDAIASYEHLGAAELLEHTRALLAELEA